MAEIIIVMKKTFFIAYDCVNRKPEDYEPLKQLLDAMGATEVQRSVWEYKPDYNLYNCDSLKDKLLKNFEDGEKLLVIEAADSAKVPR